MRQTQRSPEGPRHLHIHSSRREDSTHIGHMDVVVRGTVKHHQGLCEAGFAVSRGQGAPRFPQEDAIGLFSLIIPQAVRKLKLIKNKHAAPGPPYLACGLWHLLPHTETPKPFCIIAQELY